MMKTERMIEPKERPKPREGYPFPDINSYVAALKNRLYIPEEKLQELRRTRGVKLEKWMFAVQPVEDDRSPVRAKIGSKGVLLSSDIKLPGKITENTPVSQVIQTDALYLAKLKYLKEAAPQVTSWGRGRTKEKQIKQQITELTSRSMVGGGKIEKISFKEAITSLDPKKVAPASALATAAFALATCTGTPKPVELSPTEPVAAEVIPVPTERPTEFPTPKILSTPTETIVTADVVPLSQETIDRLAEGLVCRGRKSKICIYELSPPPDQPDIIENAGADLVSTGRVETIELKSPQTREGIGQAEAVVSITKDPDGKPMIVYIVVQMISTENPDVNLMAILTNYLAGNETDLENKTPYTNKDLERILYEGRYFSVGLSTNSYYKGIPYSQIVEQFYSDPKYLSQLEELLQSKGRGIEDGSLLIIPTSFSVKSPLSEAMSEEENQELAPLQQRYEGHISLSVPGMPENIAEKMKTETIPYRREIQEALNRQGYAPVVNSGTNKLGTLLTVDESTTCMVNSPEYLLNFGRPGRLGSENGTVYYGDYGGEIKARVISLIPFSTEEGILCSGAFITKSNNPDKLGNFVIVFFEQATGNVVRTIPAEFSGNRDIRVEWQNSTSAVYFDGKKQSY